MLASSPVVPDGVEGGQRVPDAGGVGVLAYGCARHGGVVAAVGFGAGHDVVTPTHLVLVQEIGEVGPRVDGAAGRRDRISFAVGERGIRDRRRRARRGIRWLLLPSCAGEVERQARHLQRVGATRRIVMGGAIGRPLRDHEQVRGQAPRCVRFEHVVLEHEVLRVGPVVGDLASVVPPHHIRCGRVGAGRVRGVGAVPAARLGLGDEAVHLPAVDVGGGVALAVGTTAVDVRGIVRRRHALSRCGIRHAHRRPARGHRDAVSSRVGAEVGVEGSVLLHDDDDVADLVDARRSTARRRAGRRLGAVVRARDRHQKTGDQYHGPPVHDISRLASKLTRSRPLSRPTRTARRRATRSLTR